ncbi:MAG: TIGR03084 family metal-binding protein [Gammaproteobacteria bacterium]
MQAVCDDLRIECEELHGFVAALPASAAARRTVFYEWTLYDEILHCHFLDLLGLMSLREPEQFAQIARTEGAKAKADPDYSFRAFTDRTLGRIEWSTLLGRWRATYLDMCEFFRGLDPKRRMQWFGPDMGVKSFAGARQMEVWAHGQDIYDLYRVRRRNTDRLANIASLGVRTFGWSFVNRGLAPPRPEPHVVLTGPSGAQWTWNPPSETDLVRGSAEDFCLVVTQRRNVADTALEVRGEPARAWMQIAQCFAGEPATGPAPGTRALHYETGSE